MMNLRELRSAINSIDEDYDGYAVRVIPGNGDYMLGIVPDRTGRKMPNSGYLDGILLIQRAPEE